MVRRLPFARLHPLLAAAMTTRVITLVLCLAPLWAAGCGQAYREHRARIATSIAKDRASQWLDKGYKAWDRAKDEIRRRSLKWNWPAS